MRVKVPDLEARLGMEAYAFHSRGVGGEIRRSYEDFIVEEVLTDGSKASVRLDDTPPLPSGHGRYLVCVMVKEGWDSLAATRKIAKRLGMSPEGISIAGIKDAQALTAQYISVTCVPPKRLRDISLKGIAVRPTNFSSEKISAKLLYGNHFRIAVRSIKLRSSTVRKRIGKTGEMLADRGGMPNFFGHQRFGTVRPVTHLVGRCLVKGDFDDAALIFLSKQSPHERPEANEARKRLYETRDYRKALESFPRSLMYERLMLRHLAKHPRDFLGAFHRLPQDLCRLFVQAYQSLLFNRFLSERMKRDLPLGKAQVGDYTVRLDEKGLLTRSLEKAEEHNISRINAEIAEGKRSFAIPLIGFKQSVSAGAQGEIEEEVLDKEEVRPEDFCIQKMPKTSAPGGLRTALASVLNLTINEESADEDGLSIKFSFTLHKGSYATVLLREYMKPTNPMKAGF